MATGDAVTVGPLDGTVASGDSLEAYGGSLQMTLFGITVTCTADRTAVAGSVRVRLRLTPSDSGWNCPHAAQLGRRFPLPPGTDGPSVCFRRVLH